VNHFFRLLWLAVVLRFRARVPVMGPCRTPFRVLPTDLDVLRHVNNGVYLSLMDLGRVDLMGRAGLAAPIRRRGWYPVVVAETIQFRRSLTLFERFTIVTAVLGWDDKAFLLEQRFERRGETIAVALVRARFLARAGGNVAPAEVLALAGDPPHPPAIPEHAARWNADVAVWRGSTS